jgi:hypothetical protein
MAVTETVQHYRRFIQKRSDKGAVASTLWGIKATFTVWRIKRLPFRDYTEEEEIFDGWVVPDYVPDRVFNLLRTHRSR